MKRTHPIVCTECDSEPANRIDAAGHRSYECDCGHMPDADELAAIMRAMHPTQAVDGDGASQALAECEREMRAHDGIHPVTEYAGSERKWRECKTPELCGLTMSA